MDKVFLGKVDVSKLSDDRIEAMAASMYRRARARIRYMDSRYQAEVGPDSDAAYDAFVGEQTYWAEVTPEELLGDWPIWGELQAEIERRKGRGEGI